MTVVPLIAIFLITACTTTAPPTEQPPKTPAAKAAGNTASPGPGETANSANLTPLANVPAQPPLDAGETYGSDLAFQGDYAFQGNYGGVSIYDISDPAKPTVVSTLVCPGEQNDVSVNGDLMFLSVETPRGSDDCKSGSEGDWRGIRIFDISDKKNPRYIQGIETHCGSHTHTLVPGGKAAYIYVSSLNMGPETGMCRPPHGQISVIKVPLDQPESAQVVNEPRFFEGDDVQNGRLSSGCHDITVYPEKNIGAAACMGEGLLLDISDRANPRILQRVRDEKNFDFWHSATFSNDASKVIFTDELGGGQLPTCNKRVGQEKGANGIYDLTGQGADRRLEFRSYFKIARMQSDKENCVAHNGSLIPVPGRDLMVQGWYQGGVSVLDFTDSGDPKEIAFFERGPAEGRRMGGSWSAYWYNGHVYSSDMTMGLDVLDLTDPAAAPAKKAPKVTELNVQTQQAYPE